MTDPRDPVLEVRGLAVTGRCEGVDLEVRRGEGHALVGPSGSGKTSVARALLGLLPASAGCLRLAGRPVVLGGLRHDGLLQLVPQDAQLSLDPRWRVGRTVAEPLRRLHGRRRRDAEREVVRLLRRVGLPASATAARPAALSIGQQQRVAIARALAGRPAVLVCDEPFAAQDVSLQAQLVELLDGLLREQSLGLMLLTHDLAAARQLCVTTTVLSGGQVVESGPTAGVLTDPSSPEGAQLVSAALALET